MKILRVRVGPLSETEDYTHEYTLELPDEVAQNTELCGLIAHGLLFRNDWTAEDTMSSWAVVEEADLWPT